MKKILNDDEILTLKNARTILKKLQKKYDKLYDKLDRTKDYDKVNCEIDEFLDYLFKYKIDAIDNMLFIETK